MIRLITSRQALELDKLSLQEQKIDANELIKRAAYKMASWLEKNVFKERSLRETVILIGPGNNGQDGRMLGNYLREMETLKYCKILCFEVLNSAEEAIDFLKNAIEENKNLCLIDAMFGIGLNRNLNSKLVHICDLASSVLGLKISIDIPSGLDSDTGTVRGGVFKADLTLTVGLPKPGFFVNHGPFVSGRIVTLDIGYSAQAVKKVAWSHFLFKLKDATRFLPCRHFLDNKAKVGKVLLIAGSKDMPGAAVLSGNAALRMGAGYVILYAEKPNPIWPEQFIRRDKTSEMAAVEVFRKLKNFDGAVAFGPGLGFSKWGHLRFQEILQSQYPRVVIDADGLRYIGESGKGVGKKLPSDWILTPHAGELSRLLKSVKYSTSVITASEIEADRFGWCQKAAQYFGCWVLLKGFRTVLSDGAKVYVISTGNVALAKAGTGDILTGLIVGLRAQGVSAKAAALTAATIHGWIGDLWVKSGRSELSLMPNDLIYYLPKVLGYLEKSRRS